MRVTRLNAENGFPGGFGGIPKPVTPPDLRAQAEGQLHALLLAEGIAPRAVYRPGEVCQLLRISPPTLRQFCELAEHPAVKNADPRALDSFLLSGRVPSPHFTRGAGGLAGQKPEVSARGVKGQVDSSIWTAIPSALRTATIASISFAAMAGAHWPRNRCLSDNAC